MRLKKDVGDFFKPENPKDSGISECILKKLNSVLGNDINKLVSQTYDGASIMSVKNEGAQGKLQGKYHWAWFVHCHAYQINFVILLF